MKQESSAINLFRQHIHWITVALIGIIFTWTLFNNSYWKTYRILRWDVYGYSQYLSAAFIYEDIKKPVELIHIDSVYRPTDDLLNYGRHWVNDSSTIAFKYTMGNAVMISPFYLAAHLITKTFKNFPADGYSEPYQFSVAMSSLFWSICGMAALVFLLLRWFNPVTISITLLLIALGTNYFLYATLDVGLTHIPNFFCITGALLFSLLWMERQSWKYAILFGLLSGMVALVRLPDLVFGIIPAILFSKVFFESEKAGRKKLIMQGILVLLITALVFSPQLFYWKYVSGNWFHDSYVGEKFDFAHPHIINGLFSYKKGWLLYTPLMLFALAGIPLLLKRNVWWGTGVLLFLLVNVYVIFSWWMWWYGGSFGARALVQSYGILAIPLAYFIDAVLIKGFLSKKIIAKTFSGLIVAVLLFFVSLNLFQIYQFKLRTLHHDSMTKRSYWGIFGKLRLTDKEYSECYL